MYGYIKIPKDFTEKWMWSGCASVTLLYLHLLLKAEQKNKRFCGKEVKRGQLVTSIYSLHWDTGLSLGATYKALKTLTKSGYITIGRTAKRYSLITVVDYEKYGGVD